MHLLLLRYKNAPLLGSAAGVHGGGRIVRPISYFFIASPVGYTGSTIVIANSYTPKAPAPRQLARVSLHWRTCSGDCCHRKFVFLSSSQPSPCTQEKGAPAISPRILPQPHWDIEHPSPPLCALCSKRHLQRCVLWVAGGKGEKRDIYLQSSGGQSMPPPGAGTGGHIPGPMSGGQRRAVQPPGLPLHRALCRLQPCSRGCGEGGCCLPQPQKPLANILPYKETKASETLILWGALQLAFDTFSVPRVSILPPS